MTKETWSAVNSEDNPESEERNSASSLDADNEETDSDKDSEADDEYKEAMQEQRKEDEKLINKYKKRLQEKDQTVIFEMFEMLLLKMTQVQTRIDKIERSVDSKLNKSSEALKSQKIKHQDLKLDFQDLSETVVDVVKVIYKNENDIKAFSKVQ